jgi:hypothetical protein
VGVALLEGIQQRTEILYWLLGRRLFRHGGRIARFDCGLRWLNRGWSLRRRLDDGWVVDWRLVDGWLVDDGLSDGRFRAMLRGRFLKVLRGDMVGFWKALVCHGRLHLHSPTTAPLRWGKPPAVGQTLAIRSHGLDWFSCSEPEFMETR